MATKKHQMMPQFSVVAVERRIGSCPLKTELGESLLNSVLLHLGISRHFLGELAVTSEGHAVENQGSENSFIFVSGNMFFS